MTLPSPTLIEPLFSPLALTCNVPLPILERRSFSTPFTFQVTVLSSPTCTPAPCQVALFSEDTVKLPSKYKPPAPWLMLVDKVTVPFF